MADEMTGTPEVPTTDPSATSELAAPEAQSQELGNEAPTDSAAEATPATDLFTVKVGGEEVQVSVQEALNGYMRQADYTRKTQEVAQQREDLGFAARIEEALQSDPARAIEALRVAYGLDGQQAAQEDPEPLSDVEQLQQRLEGYIADQELRAFEAQTRADLAEMHTHFGEFDDGAVLNYAIEHGIPSIQDAVKAFVFDSVMGFAQRQVAERNAQSAKQNLPPVAGGHGVAGGSVQSGGAAPVNTLEQALELALEAHPGVVL